MDTFKLIDCVKKREVKWLNGKSESQEQFGKDVESGIYIENSFKHWRDKQGVIYLSSWFVKA